MIKCCLCGKEITDKYGGHNAQPLADGRCCDDCNVNKVIPARLSEVASKENRR